MNIYIHAKLLHRELDIKSFKVFKI